MKISDIDQFCTKAPKINSYPQITMALIKMKRLVTKWRISFNNLYQ